MSVSEPVQETSCLEIMHDPVQVFDYKGEWLEIYNNSGDSVDLDGLILQTTRKASQSPEHLWPTELRRLDCSRCTFSKRSDGCYRYNETAIVSTHLMRDFVMVQQPSIL